MYLPKLLRDACKAQQPRVSLIETDLAKEGGRGFGKTNTGLSFNVKLKHYQSCGGDSPKNSLSLVLAGWGGGVEEG